MNNMHNRLMFPEPEDTGSGDAATPETDDFAALDFEAVDEKAEQEGMMEVPSEHEVQAETTADEGEYTLTLDEGLDLEEAEVNFFAEAAKAHGLPADTASKFVSQVVKQVNENNARAMKEEEQKAVDSLRKKWGNEYKRKLAQTASFVARVGKAAGWSKEQMEAFKNPHSMEVFHDVMRATSARLTLGASQPVYVEPKLTKAEMITKSSQVLNSFFDARRAGDYTRAQALADEHYTLQQQITGNKSCPRLL